MTNVFQPTASDEQYMRRCFQLALCGMGRVRPNPMVGCVVVKDGAVVAEGYHREYGGFHAERNALLSTAADLRGATLYVNLEPCSHYGKTPPCADMVIERGISRVVCCNDDPNPLVAGRGFARLRQAGIDVVRHVLEEEGRHLNRRFFTFMEQRRPYVILKWAVSSDGFMAPPKSVEPVVQSTATQGSRGEASNPAATHSYWLSTPQQTLLSHRWRTEESAILVGSQTFIDDHPALTARLFFGQQPQPIVLDRRGRLRDVPPHWLHLAPSSLPQLMDILFQRNIQSLIVEGGRQVLDAFISADLYDEVRIIRTPAILGTGLAAPATPRRGVAYFDA